MIKLPKEVHRVIKTLEGEGWDTYAVGGCVRDSLLGLAPTDWDLATKAEMEVVLGLLPEAGILSEKYHVVRIPLDGGNIDIVTFRKEGPYTDRRRPDWTQRVETIEEDLVRRDFTINAIADNPERPIVDPFGGREDLRNRLIRCVGEPEQRFNEDPLRMLRAVRFAAELGFDLHKSVYEGIVACRDLAAELSKDRIRGEFQRLINGEQAGKGLRMLMGTGLLSVVIGEEAAGRMSRRELENYETLTENIHKTMRVPERRLGLFYTALEEARALKALAYLEYSGKMDQCLKDAVLLTQQVYFLSNKYDLKRFLIRHGMERYEYLHNLTKAQRIVYDYDEHKIMARTVILEDIYKFKEPVFIEDLAITGQDLLDAGIAEGEKIGKILLMLVDVVHMKPNLNTREQLMKYAKSFSKSRISAATRNIRFIK
jgi:tRNA nucleotidyltransferase (CCA-adding enzyme)